MSYPQRVDKVIKGLDAWIINRQRKRLDCHALLEAVEVLKQGKHLQEDLDKARKRIIELEKCDD